jgi:hypothetical protein
MLWDHSEFVQRETVSYTILELVFLALHPCEYQHCSWFKLHPLILMNEKAAFKVALI